MAEPQLPDGVKPLGINNPTEYKVEYPNQKSVDKNGFTVKRTLVAIFDAADGDYDLYQKAPLTGALGSPFYSYNAGSRTKTVRNKTIYNQFTSVFNGIDRSTKDNILKTSKYRITGSTSKREAKALAEHPDFKSIAGGENVDRSENDDAAAANTDETAEEKAERLKAEQEAKAEAAAARTGEGDGDNTSEDEQRSSTPIDITEAKMAKIEGSVKTNELLAYPEYIPEGLKYDHIHISAYEYVPAGVGLTPSGGPAEERYKSVEKSLGSVILPMQPNFSESNAVAWGGDMLNAVQGAFADAALGAITDLSSIKVIEAAKGILDDGLNLVDKFGSEGGSFIAAYFAGQAVKANIIGRTTGSVINPNLELLFNGPKLRTFKFSFKLTPRSANEAKTIRKIIKYFKANMAAQRSASNLFLLSPNVFKLKYISGFSDEQNPYMNKIKPCALSSFNVNYTPDGSYMTYNDRNNPSMTSYDIGLMFSEIEPIYADEIDYTSNDMSY
tara:strand:+ start:2165 stop:3661 length:1497 start_codon:yes stop_codon:yes gene_type:complete